MASSGPSDSGPLAGGSAPQEITNVPSRTSTEAPLSSTPLEMTTLESKQDNAPPSPPPEPTIAPKQDDEPPSPISHAPAPPSVPSPENSSPSHPVLDRTMSTAIGPSSDQPMPITKDPEGTGPTLMITLLLTNGARHPFKLDSKYLNKRNVKVPNNDPFDLSVYTLKELILREWREEWEQKPSSPSSIRLISFGKLLDDKAPLKDSKFSPDAPNVVHMTIKPQEIVDEEDKGAKGALSGRDGEGSVRSPGCRCVIL